MQGPFAFFRENAKGPIVIADLIGNLPPRASVLFGTQTNTQSAEYKLLGSRSLSLPHGLKVAATARRTPGGVLFAAAVRRAAGFDNDRQRHLVLIYLRVLPTSNIFRGRQHFRPFLPSTSKILRGGRHPQRESVGLKKQTSPKTVILRNPQTDEEPSTLLRECAKNRGNLGESLAIYLCFLLILLILRKNSQRKNSEYQNPFPFIKKPGKSI